MKNLIENNKILLCRLKIIGFSSLIVLSYLLLIISIISCIQVGTSVNYSEKNIVDDYGNLKENERQVIEETLKSCMKNKKVNLFFASVYEDINSKYASSFPNDCIIVYYNNNTFKLDVVSKLDELKKQDFSVTLNSSDELLEKFPEYLEQITSKIKTKSKVMYFNSHFNIALCFVSLIFSIAISIFLVMATSSHFNTKIKTELEIIAEEKSLTKIENETVTETESEIQSENINTDDAE